MFDFISNKMQTYEKKTKTANEEQKKLERYGTKLILHAGAYWKVRDLSLFIARGGGGAEDLGLNKVKFSRFPLGMLLHFSDPPKNI